MKVKEQHLWFLGFTAVFAALAGFVFWGTWSSNFVFVQPDSPILFPKTWLGDFWREWRTTGSFVPGDLQMILGEPGWRRELFYALGAYFSGLAMMYFLRGRGLSRLASYGAGLLLAFCGYWFTLFSAGHGSWFIWMTYGLWPFGLLDRAITKGKLKNWLLLGATVGWASYWQIDLWLLFTTFTGVYFIFRCIVERRFPWKGMLVAGVTMFVIGGAGFRGAIVVGLASRDKQIEEGQTISPKDMETVDEREKRWIFVTNWSLPPAESAEFFIPRLNGDTSCPMTLTLGARYGTGVKPYTGALGRPKDAPAGNYRQHSLYVGFVTCLLALVGIAFVFVNATSSPRLKKVDFDLGPGAARRRVYDVTFFAVAAILCWLFSMGRYCEPVYRVIFSLPFGDYLRAPVKWHHLTEFCICVLAGYGIDSLKGMLERMLERRKEKGEGRKCGILVSLILGGVVLIGAIDLARIDHLYCAPVDLREAKRQNCNMQMTFLRRADFNNPQVAAMVQAKKIVPLAQPNPETYLVGILQPWGKNTKPMPPMSATAWLSVLSMIGTLGLAGYGVKRALSK